MQKISSRYQIMFSKDATVYTILKLGHYAVADEIENLMIDDPAGADRLLTACAYFMRARARVWSLKD